MADRALSVPSFTCREQQPAPSAAHRAAGATVGRTRTAALAIMACLAAPGLMAAGCSSDDGEPLADYEGTWRTTVDPTFANSFTLNCPDLSPPFHDDFPLFTTIRLEPGTVTDLFDLAGPGSCQFAYDHVTGKKTIALVNPDPLSGAAVKCSVNLSKSTDATTGDPVSTDLVITPTSWSLNLQPGTKGKAPLAQLVADAAVDLVDTAVNATNVPRVLGTSGCTYAIREYLDKLTKL